MRCEKCGWEIVEGDSFCMNCGAPVAVSEQACENRPPDVPDWSKADAGEKTGSGRARSARSRWIAVAAAVALVAVGVFAITQIMASQRAHERAVAPAGEISSVAGSVEKARAEEPERERAELEARRDKISGTFTCFGGRAPRRVSSVSVGENELVIVGSICDDSTKTWLESKTWRFGIDDDTVFGLTDGEGFKPESREDMKDLESVRFPTLTMTIEDGVVKRANQHS